MVAEMEVDVGEVNSRGGRAVIQGAMDERAGLHGAMDGRAGLHVAMDGRAGDKRGSGFFIKQRHTGLV